MKIYSFDSGHKQKSPQVMEVIFVKDLAPARQLWIFQKLGHCLVRI